MRSKSSGLPAWRIFIGAGQDASAFLNRQPVQNMHMLVLQLAAGNRPAGQTAWLLPICTAGPQTPRRTLERVILSSQENACVVDQAGHAHARQLVGQRLQRGCA